ncbi:MAG: hypothetical protein JEY97_09425 [Bacteroidales bacterium]|nr:hypothetical protein [Bacteroidales bacterium]
MISFSKYKNQIFFISLFFINFSLFSQWDPNAGLIPSYTNNCTLKTSSGENADNVIDGRIETFWMSEAALPINFYKREGLNFLLHQPNYSISTSLSKNIKNVVDADINSSSIIEVINEEALLKISFNEAIVIKSFIAKCSTRDKILIQYILSNGVTIPCGIFSKSENYSMQNYKAPEHAVKAILFSSKIEFTIFEIAVRTKPVEEFVMIDLEYQRSIGWIESKHYSETSKTIELLLSNDKENWLKVADLNPLTSIMTTNIIDPPIYARYIKILHTLSENDYAKAWTWELKAWDENGPYGKMPPSKPSRHSISEILGINGFWGWGYNIYSDSLKTGQGPSLYSRFASFARNYHNYDWDVPNPDVIPDFKKMSKGEGTKSLEWLNWDREYKAWTDAGLSVEACITFNNSIFPSEKWSNPYQSAYDYGKEFAKHFGPTYGNSMVKIIEIGNEPWAYPAGWYKSILLGMAKGIHNSDPKIEIFPCALQAAFPDEEYDWGGNYIGARLTPEAAQYLSGINSHYYSHVINENGERISVNPENIRSGLRGILNDIRFRDKNMPGKQIILSEWGWDSEGGVEDCTHPACVSENAQAIYAIRSLLIFSRLGIDKAIWYFFANENIKSRLHGRSGVTSSSKTGFRIKKSFLAFESLIKLIGDKYFLTTLKEDKMAYIYLFGDKNGNPTHIVAWKPVNSKDKSKSLIRIKTQDKVDAAFFIDGNSSNGSSTKIPVYENGEIILEVYSTPIIVSLFQNK